MTGDQVIVGRCVRWRMSRTGRCRAGRRSSPRDGGPQKNVVNLNDCLREDQLVEVARMEIKSAHRERETERPRDRETERTSP
jgi:hypothetical protein